MVLKKNGFLSPLVPWVIVSGAGGNNLLINRSLKLSTLWVKIISEETFWFSSSCVFLKSRIASQTCGLIQCSDPGQVGVHGNGKGDKECEEESGEPQRETVEPTHPHHRQPTLASDTSRFPCFYLVCWQNQNQTSQLSWAINWSDMTRLEEK